MPTKAQLENQLRQLRRELQFLPELQDQLRQLAEENRGLQARANAAPAGAPAATPPPAAADVRAPPPPPLPAHPGRVKLAPFWEDQPEAWFSQAELLFKASQVTDEETRFGLVVGRLEQHQAAEVADLLRKPPAAAYTAVKQRLTERYGGSPEERMAQLLATEELGDRRPSEMLRHMRHLAGEEVSPAMLRRLWLQRLPQSIRAILLAQPNLPPDEAARVADDIAAASPGPSVCATTPNPDVAALTDCVAKLAEQVAALSRNTRRGNQRGQGQGRDKPPADDTSTPADDGLCWYHRTFGGKATKCRPPCSFQQQENANGGRQ